MQDLLEQITLVNILSVLLLIASIWLLVIIVQKKTGYMFRGMIFFLFVLLALIYFQQSDAQKFTISDIKYALFPKKSLTLNYHTEEDSQRRTVARYVFDEPIPRIPVSMDADGKYFHITNIKVINEILSRMGLPQIKKGAQELVSITGSTSHKNLYRWDDYPKGILILERNICKNKQTLETFNCLATITIRQKYSQ
ncbi:MAG: hypothetical protein GQ545_11160 [Candidatus Aminicenantes bacterium]|nr:hypothetical protein [Candidatus Aminicenantes bacterium]